MLEINNISKAFQQRGIVLDNLSLKTERGDSVAISGPSGSGKTTLLSIIAALEKPDSGEVIFDGELVHTMDSDTSARYRNRKIGFVFQENLLLPHLTVWQNIILPLIAFNISSIEREEKENNAKEMMVRTGITELANKYPSQISGGEAQRTSIVRALVNKPSLLLADEPTGSLDKENARILGELLKELNSEIGISIILSTHSQSLASFMKKNLSLTDGRLT